jgi:hypothetical protein
MYITEHGSVNWRAERNSASHTGGVLGASVLLLNGVHDVAVPEHGVAGVDVGYRYHGGIEEQVLVQYIRKLYFRRYGDND